MSLTQRFIITNLKKTGKITAVIKVCVKQKIIETKFKKQNIHLSEE
jgi:hypothetical protein